MPNTLEAYFLVGPTASGKSGVAHRIAREAGYDILSADSMAVYEGMDIGTAKPSSAQRREVRYHGIDLTSPDQPFSVGDYRRHACGCIRASLASGRSVIVVGGTGLYVKSLTHGLVPTPEPRPEDRQRWTALYERDGVEALQRELETRAPTVYAAVRDKRNWRRLVRALERAEAGWTQAPASWTNRAVEAGAPLAALVWPAAAAQDRMRKRVETMYQAGLIEEVRGLLARYALSSTARHAIGYAEPSDVLEARCTREQAMAKTLQRTRRLAKRQRTWFRHQANVRWIGVRAGMNEAVVAERVLAHWRRYGPTAISEAE